MATAIIVLALALALALALLPGLSTALTAKASGFVPRVASRLGHRSG